MHKCRRANTKYNTTVLSIQTSYLRHEHGMEHNSFRLMKKKVHLVNSGIKIQISVFLKAWLSLREKSVSCIVRIRKMNE